MARRTEEHAGDHIEMRISRREERLTHIAYAHSESVVAVAAIAREQQQQQQLKHQHE